MAKKVLSENIEEYLEVLYDHSDSDNYVSTTIISKSLNIAPGSVTQMLKKLEQGEYINYEPYKGAMLSDKGYKIAKKIKRKHRILEKFLSDVLNIDEKNIHQQACEMEHSLSDEAERAMCHLMKHPDECPGKQLIPECDFDFNNCEECLDNDESIEEIGIRSDNLLSLTQITANNEGEVLFIRSNSNTLDEFSEVSVCIGAKIAIIENNVKESNKIIIKVNNQKKELKRELANNIFLKLN
ncbi:metal-dependent transcriptional regulator [Methanobrevibacter filiformis]|uniref:Transcriptional regulator MntR n=1 Tax=Methanobrevibacter filiformis TaxID=55758 RepID=A0A166CM41_9EURY|nr:metal-dependent transcriptional regulator [Methanobrevibacter filiformis]KZX15387.1 transcriptional regulator MntR [Methanobrevibacter filiformis]